MVLDASLTLSLQTCLHFGKLTFVYFVHFFSLRIIIITFTLSLWPNKQSYMEGLFGTSHSISTEKDLDWHLIVHLRI